MREDEGLLRDIQARPEDDAPRLVCADWYEEHGDPDRAAFIRVQIELARMSLWDRRRQALARQEYELFAKHGNRWSAPLIGAVSRWQYRRGFVEQVKVEAAQFLRHAEMLWQLFPVREVKFDHPTGHEIRKIAASPWLARVEKLDLTFSRMGDEGLGPLLHSPNVPALRGLVLRWCNLSPLGLRLLARTANMPALEALDLSSNEEAGPEGIAAFLTECRLPRLADVRWGYDGWSLEVCMALLASPLMPRVKALEHFGHRTPDEAVFSLMADGRWDGLEELDFTLHELTTEAAEGLARNTSLSSLRKLELTGPIGDAGLKALVHAPLAAKLEELRLGGCGITWRGVRELAASPNLARLQFLDLDDNHVGDSGCKALAESKTLTSLQGLHLKECGITPRGAKALAGPPLGERLGYLNIQKNGPFSPRTLRPLEQRLGDGLEHADRDRQDWKEWSIANAKVNPPRCLSGFAVRADTPLALRVWKERLGGNPEYVALELAHPSDPGQRVTMLGYWHHYGSGKMLMSPLAVRWQPSGELVELFDAEQHGYLAEHDGNCTVHGSGRRILWKCPHEGCRDHTLIACFRYREYPPEKHLDRYFAPQEQYRMFYLYAYCQARDDLTFVSESECK
jgi:uncharacterized protein (TIGR02996 family)